MISRVELDLPAGDETLPFRDLAGFVDHARTLGATADTPVLAVGAPQDTSILTALRVQTDGLIVRADDLRVDRADVKDLLDLLTEIDDNDGDARSHMQSVRELRQRLTHIALRP